MKILVAGEQRELGDSLLLFLARKGHTLLFVQTAEEFIARVRTEPPDLIIIDLELSTLDSFGISERLRTELQALSTPVIAVAESTRLTPCLKELGRLLKENTVAVLDKPVDPQDLEQAIARVLDKRTLKPGCLPHDTLEQLVDGELSKQEVEHTQHHLSWCQSCQQQYEEVRKTDSVLRKSFSKAMRIRIESSEECISPRKLTAYFRDGLPSHERTAIEEHLSGCSYCTRELVSLYKLMKEFGEKETEPLGEEILKRLRVAMRELLDKAKGPLICIHCFGSIPLESESCPRCGAWVRGKAQENDGTETGSREDRDREAGGTPSDQGYLGTRRVQVAGSLFALAVVASVILLGITTYQNYRFNVIARPAINKVNTLFSAEGRNIFAEHIRKSIEEEIEVFGQVAMYESKPTPFEVPPDAEWIARMLVEDHYHNGTVAEKALRYGDIWDAFGVLNRSENRGLKSRFLPKYTNRILGPGEMQVLKDEMSGSYTGIGVFARRARWGNGNEITGFTKDSPAEKAGLEVGDIITEIDGTSLRGLDVAQATALVRGPVGTRVKLQVRRSGGTDFGLWVWREQSEVPGADVQYTRLQGDNAYVRVSGLRGGVTENLEKALTELKNDDVKRLVLDLRGNVGGTVQTATDIAALFLPEGTLIARIGSGSGERGCYVERTPIWDGPLAVLTDNRTMSGAELIAAALQWAGRAIIVGEKTAGKGSVQTIYRLKSGHGVQLTTSLLAGPGGVVFNKHGVEPDVEVIAGRRAGIPRYSREEVFVDTVVEIAVERLVEEAAFSTSGKGRIRDERRTDQGGKGASEHFFGRL